MALYTDDGVFMPQHFPSSVGSSAVRTAYDGVFKAIKLDVSFDIVEVRQVSPHWAFARTNSAGTVKVLVFPPPIHHAAETAIQQCSNGGDPSSLGRLLRRHDQPATTGREEPWKIALSSAWFLCSDAHEGHGRRRDGPDRVS